MSTPDNDIELLAGQVWNAPAERERQVPAWLRPQVDLLRRAPKPGESGLAHEPPHFGYLLDKKEGA